LAAGLRPDPLGDRAHNAAPNSLAEFRGGEGWQRKTVGQREGEGYIKGRREDGREEKDGGGKE